MPSLTVTWSGIKPALDAWYEYMHIRAGTSMFVEGDRRITLGPLIVVDAHSTLYRWVTCIRDYSTGIIITRITEADVIARTAAISWQSITYARASVRTESVEDRERRIELEEERLAVMMARLDAVAAEAARRRKERKIQRALANEHALKLLTAQLDDTQRTDLAATGSFKLTSKEGRKYQIQCRRAGNVVEYVIEDGVEIAIARYCYHFIDHVPVADDMLLALLMLRFKEAEYLRIANKSTHCFPMPLSQADWNEQPTDAGVEGDLT